MWTTPQIPPWPYLANTPRTWSGLVRSTVCTSISALSLSWGDASAGRASRAILATRSRALGDELWWLSTETTLYLRVCCSAKMTCEPADAAEACVGIAGGLTLLTSEPGTKSERDPRAPGEMRTGTERTRVRTNVTSPPGN